MKNIPDIKIYVSPRKWGSGIMAKPFNLLLDQMSPEAQKKSEEKAHEMLRSVSRPYENVFDAWESVWNSY